MKEGLNFDGIKTALKLKFERVKPFVESENLRLKNAIIAPSVADDCPENRRELANRLVAIQTKKGEIKTEDIDKKDVSTLKDMTKLKAKKSFREAISSLVDNAYFVDYDVVNARHILKFLYEFNENYNKFYVENGTLPLNGFSDETRIFIKNMKTGLSKEEVMRTILQVYLPEYAGIEMTHHDYSLVPKSKLSKEKIDRIVAELSSIAVDNNLDAIFSNKYESYFKKLCEILKQSGYTFDSFIRQHTNFEYTLCFKCDIVKAVRKMCKGYKYANNTMVGIQQNDPYLYTKIDLAKEILGVYTLSEVFLMMGIDADNYDTSKKILSNEEISHRENILFSKLEDMFPDKFIPVKSRLNDREVYEELLFLARRRKFANVNDYLAKHGFERDLNYNAKVNRSMFLSERDIIHYGFLSGCKTPEDVERILAENGVILADPYTSFGIYKKLANQKLDSEAKLKSQTTETIKKLLS